MLIPFITARGSPYLSLTDTGLGNVLFQVASTIGLADTLGTNYSMYYLEEFGRTLMERFSYNHKDTIFKKVLGSCNNSIETDCVTVHEANNKGKHYYPPLIEAVKQSLDKHACVVINGYLESYCYFDKVAPRIKELFRADAETERLLFEKYPFLTDDRVVVVAVHCRYHDGSPVEYYKKAITLMSEQLTVTGKQIQFLLFSNNLSLFKEQLQGVVPAESIWVKEAYDYLELWLMSYCHHYIIGLSTFSWWGCFLSRCEEKIVFYPQHAIDFFGKSGHCLPKEDVQEKYFYPTFRCIS